MSLGTLLDTPLLGDPLSRWLIAVGVVIVAYTLLRTARGLVRRRLRLIAERTAFAFDDVVTDVLGATHTISFLAAAVYAGSLVLTLEAQVRSAVSHAVVVVLLIQGALWANRALKTVLERYRKDETLGSSRRTGLAAIGFVGRLALFAMVLLLALENLGVHVTTLLAGLGISSLAVALALQNILGDLFASLSIVFDKPFEIGDFIIVDAHMGAVEHVGLRTTRIRSLSGEQLVFSNNDLIKSRIRNYKRMAERRVVFSLGVTYATSRELVARIPSMLRAIVEAQPKVRFDRSHFKEFGPSSLNFEIVYWVLEADYNLYMDIQQTINLAIMETFEDHGIDFAFPTQTVFLEGGERPPLLPPRSRSEWAAETGPEGASADG